MDAKRCCSICLKENSNQTLDDPDNLVTFTNCCQQPVHITCLEQWFLSCISNGWDETCPYCRHVWETDESIPGGLDFDMEELVNEELVNEELIDQEVLIDDEEELDWNLHIVPQLNAFLELIRGNNLDDFQNKAALIYILDICHRYLEQHSLVQHPPPSPSHPIDPELLIEAQLGGCHDRFRLKFKEFYQMLVRIRENSTIPRFIETVTSGFPFVTRSDLI